MRPHWLRRGVLAALPIAAAAFLAAGVASAADPVTIEVTIRDHRFTPAEIRVPAGQPVVLTIRNEDATAEEFESNALKVEKVIPGRSVGTVRLRPLSPGHYAFIGEHHPQTAKGIVIAE